MLRTMLNSHPELAVPHETRFIVDAYRARATWGDLSEQANRRKLARWVVKRKKSRVGRLVEDPEQLVEAMIAAPPTIGSVLATGFQVYAARQGKPRWGDKRPSYILNLDAIFAMVPDAQFVNVVRDPRAAIASIIKIGWYQDGLGAGIDIWERSVEQADRARRKLGEDQFHEIVYEQMVADPRGELEQLVAFLGLDPAGLDAMLAFHETADIKSKKMHPLVAKPVTDEALRSWETAMQPAEIALIEQELAGQMARYGYEPAATGVEVPAELRTRLAARRKKTRDDRRKRRRTEFKLRFTYRRPVARRPYEPKIASTTRPDAPPSSSSQNVETKAS
jgi:Sulfotransferase family